jgi:hypothetical protein
LHSGAGSSLDQIRVGIVGHRTWFENHFPEHWRKRHNILCLDVDEWDYSFLTQMINFRPDLTLFYRPELYPERYLRSIRGRRVAFLSEPLPASSAHDSEETQLRERVYARMAWSAYHEAYYYDSSKQSAVDTRRWPITGYRPLPIDTSVFKPSARSRPIDLCFIGKPTPHRVAALDFLRSTDLNFVWIAHGVSGSSLASVFRRSKVVLNIHADAHPALEPRVYLAAACGCAVLSEALGSPAAILADQIREFDGHLDYRLATEALQLFRSDGAAWQTRNDYLELSVDSFLESLAAGVRNEH